MYTRKPTDVDKDLVEVLINKSDLNDKSKQVLMQLLLDDNKIRIFRERNNYVKTCKAIINMNISDNIKEDLYTYYDKIFRFFLGYYQLLVNDTNEIKKGHKIYFKFCDLDQCKNDSSFFQTSQFLFDIYYKVSNLNEYNAIIEIIDINDQYFDVLNEYMYDDSICPIKFKENILLFLANNSSKLDKEHYRSRVKQFFKKEKGLYKIKALNKN